MTSIHGKTLRVLKGENNECIGTGAKRTLHKIKKVVHLTNRVYGTMTGFSSRNTSLLLFMSD